MAQSAIRVKPKIVSTGNAFLAIVRAQQALADAGWTESELAAFRQEAGYYAVLKHPTKQTPPEVKERALATVARYCEVYSPRLGDLT